MRHKVINLEEFNTAGWAELESLSSVGCECCGEQFSVSNPPDLTSSCHQGPVCVSYWRGFIYLSCGVCDKPICKIEVSKSLL